MKNYYKGDIVVIEFPFSNLSESKRRPVLVLKNPKGEDVIVVQITGSSYEKNSEILLIIDDFKQGNLNRNSYIRIDKIASIEKSLIKYKVGSLKQEKFNYILEKIISFLKD
jgi:mRNA interferase MazF